MNNIFFYIATLFTLCACNGIDLGVYSSEEQANNTPIIEKDTTTVGDSTIIETTVTGEFYIDASDWKEWHYIDLHAIHDQIVNTGSILETFPPYPIPMTETDNWNGRSGIVYYWYDIFGKGLSENHRSDESFFEECNVSDIHTAPQPEPDSWDLAVHRGNVRTNGGTAFQTTIQDISQITSKDPYLHETFTPDSWNETDVWTVQDYLLTQNVGNQAIAINPVLSSWLQLRIPPIPPSYTYNGNVFILRMQDGKYAAIRLKNYYNRKSCCLTIEFKYPLK